MASRRLVSVAAREALLGIPSDTASLERNYLLTDEDLDLIGTRRRPENCLGLAIHIALLRHPMISSRYRYPAHGDRAALGPDVRPKGTENVL